MKTVANNRKAFYDFFVDDKFEAGISLQGWEVKSARAGEVNLQDSFVFFRDGQAYLKNAYFAPYKDGVVETQELRRSRKLLLKKSQIQKLHTAVKQKGSTCIATKIYLNPRGLVKAEIALARGKHTYDKKQSLKEKDIARETKRSII